MTTTKTARRLYQTIALDHFSARDRLRAERAQLLADAYADLETRGIDPGPLVSGIESYQFPEATRYALRANARAITDAMDQSVKYWRWAGRRLVTWRRENETRSRPTVQGYSSRY